MKVDTAVTSQKSHYSHRNFFITNNSELSEQTETEETLLLSTAALANLTFSHPEAVQLMVKYRTALVLVQSSSLRKELSVFIKDQVSN